MTPIDALLRGIGALALFVCAGWGLGEIVGFRSGLSLVQRLGHTYLLGVAWVGGSAWVASHCGGLTLRRGVLLPLGVLPLLAGIVVASWRRGVPLARVRDRVPRGWRALGLLAGVGVGVVTVGLFADAVSSPIHDFDGTATWGACARWIRAERTASPRVLRDERFFVNHPRYPILLPLAQVVVHEVFDTDGDERAVRIVYSSFYPAFLLVLLVEARRAVGYRAATMTLLVVALIPIFAFWSSDDGGANTTYCDFPLACFWGAGLLLLLRPSLEPGTAIAAGVLIGAGVLTKQEGTPLAVVAFVTVLAGTCARHRRMSRKLGHVALAITPPVAAIALLYSWRRGIPNRFDENYAFPPLNDFLHRLAERAPQLPGALWIEMADARVWDGFWYLMALLLLVGVRAFRRRPVQLVALALAGGLAVYFVAYMITPWPDVVLVHPTWNRFLLQLALPGSILLAAAFREILDAMTQGQSPHLERSTTTTSA